MTDPSLIRPPRPFEPQPVLARVTVHLWGMAPGYSYYVDPDAPYVREKIAQGYIVLIEPEAPAAEVPVAAPVVAVEEEAPTDDEPDDDEEIEVVVEDL